jgi:deazaflavin-dependent oxidoreductase (nitroreductase family)
MVSVDAWNEEVAMPAERDARSSGTPPAWVNRAVAVALHTPGLRALVGRGITEIAVTGARSGRTYRTPVQYVRHGEDIVVLTQPRRRWWRNLADQPRIELLIDGRTVAADAVVLDGDEARPIAEHYLAGQAGAARHYGIAVDRDGHVSPDELDRVLGETVVILATPVPTTPPG